MRGSGRTAAGRESAPRALTAAAPASVRVLGIDPGSTCTGYGVVRGTGNEVLYVASGTIASPRSRARFDRLRAIYAGIAAVIQEFEPTHVAIEDVFYSKNPRSALVLGEARGAAILAASLADLPIYEYSAREVKLSVTGNGAADKSQVGYMLGKILKLDAVPESTDESDAIAIAMCHAFRRRDWSPR